MVKLPQGTIGYAVDGAIVFKPTRPAPETVRHKHGVTKPQVAKPPKLSKKCRIAARRSKALLHERVRLQSQMEHLKNACKQGDLERALVTAYSMVVGDFGTGEMRGTVSAMTRILFTPDIEGRSAIYYAAHTGHEELVQIFLAILVLECTWRRQSSFDMQLNSAPKTILAWLDDVGFSRLFVSRADLELCILNALNESTKQVFRQKKYSWEDLLKTVKRLDLIGFFYKHRVSISNAFIQRQLPSLTSYNVRKKHPKVVMDDEFMHDVDEEEIDSYDYSDLEEPKDCPYPSSYSDAFHDHGQWVGEDAFETSHGDDDQSLVDLESVWSDFDPECNEHVFERLPSHSLSATSTFQLCHDEDDLTWMESHDGKTSNFSIVQSKSELNTVAITDWEILSDLNSVISLESQHQIRKTYLDVLQENLPVKESSGTPVKQHSHNQRHKLPKMSEVNDEDDESITFDAIFAVEGFKGARGGRRARMFTGEGKTRSVKR